MQVVPAWAMTIIMHLVKVQQQHRDPQVRPGVLTLPRSLTLLLYCKTLDVRAQLDYHAPQKHYLPKKNLPELFWNYPKNLLRLFLGDNPEVIQEPLPLRPGILVKKSVVLLKRKNGFTKTIPWTENPGKIKKTFFVNPFSRFTKTSDFLTKIFRF